MTIEEFIKARLAEDEDVAAGAMHPGTSPATTPPACCGPTIPTTSRSGAHDHDYGFHRGKTRCR